MDGGVRVSDVMSREVLTVAPDAVVGAAADRLAGVGVGSVVIVRDGAPAGILTTGDVAAVVASHAGTETTRVAEVMTTDPTTVAPDSDLLTAARRMREGGFEHLPVVEAGQLVGIVSTTDIAYVLPRVLTDTDADG